MPTANELREQMRGHLLQGKAILDAADAEHRDLTPAEQDKADQHIAQAKDLKSRADRAADDQSVRAAIADLGAAINSGTSSKAALPEWATKHRSGQSHWVKSSVERISKIHAASGGKAVISGSVDVATPITTDIARIPEFPRRLLDLLVTRQQLNQGNVFTWLKQTVRTDNAAPVADGALKPTSVYTFTEEEDRVRTVAHLSESLPLRFLSDYTALQDFLSSEMERGLFLAVEDQVLNGDGVGENMIGILATSGIRAQAFSGDLLTTLRKAATTLEVNGEVPNAWCMHPVDVENLDLEQDNEGRMYFSGPQQQLATTSPVWSLPVVKSLAVTPGTSVLADWTAVRLVVRQDATLDIDTSGTLFTHNQFVARLEGRFGVAVLRPGAFCQVDLTA